MNDATVVAKNEADWLATRMVNSFKVLYAALDGAWVEDRLGGHLFVYPAVPIPAFNAIIAVEQRPDDAVSGLACAMAEVEKLGLPFGVLLRATVAPALEAEARRLGLTQAERIPAMVMAADELRDRGTAGLEIVKVRERADLERALALMAAGFDAPPALFQPIYQPAITDMPSASIYLASVDGEPVSTAVSWQGDGGVGIFNVATPPALRGRGYGAAVTARAAEDGFAAHAELAWLQASVMGEPVYRRMGFRQVDTHLLLTRPPSGE
ncbi:MAG TPA: GNAT family N-acetyltransferase [Candidatus Dormibacteraeota bacterium]